tara:strand:+ start:647 stop:841 length:195 start_codon:yes stop_codon:yes gene_type:complete
MKIGDLVILEYNGVDLEEKDRLKIGIVKTIHDPKDKYEMAQVLWGSGDLRWCLQEQLKTVKKCP